MSKRIYVGNLPYTATEADIKEAFEKHGAVHSVDVMIDRETGRARGFAFVDMDDADADKAIQAMNGANLAGRALRVNEARERTDRGSGPRMGGGMDRPRRPF
jgi:RNA recognition motif-containing protein